MLDIVAFFLSFWISAVETDRTVNHRVQVSFSFMKREQVSNNGWVHSVDARVSINGYKAYKMKHMQVAVQLLTVALPGTAIVKEVVKWESHNLKFGVFFSSHVQNINLLGRKWE